MATSFEVLGIPNGASEEEIKVAFRLKIKEVYFRDRKCAEELIAARDAALRSARARDLVPAESRELVAFLIQEQARARRADDDYEDLKIQRINRATNLYQKTKIVSGYLAIICAFVALLATQKPDLYKLIFTNKYDAGVRASQYALNKVARVRSIVRSRIADLDTERGINQSDPFFFPPDELMRGYVPDKWFSRPKRPVLTPYELLVYVTDNTMPIPSSPVYGEEPNLDAFYTLIEDHYTAKARYMEDIQKRT